MTVSQYDFFDSGDFDCSTSTNSPILGTTSVRAQRTGGSGDDGGNFVNNTASGGSAQMIRALFKRVSGFTSAADKVGVTLNQFNGANLTNGNQDWYWAYVTGTGEVRVEYWGNNDMFGIAPTGPDPDKVVLASGSFITITTGVPFSIQFARKPTAYHPETVVTGPNAGFQYEVRVGTATDFSDLNTEVVLYRVFVDFTTGSAFPSVGGPGVTLDEGAAFYSNNGGAFDVRCDSLQAWFTGQF